MRLDPPLDGLLVAQRIAVAYRRRPILRQVSLAVQAGEIVGLVGPNGSGKSTLLRALLGLRPVTSGDVWLGGARLGSLSRREIARRAALVSQDSPIEFEFTARELVAMGRTPYRGRLAAETGDDRDAILRAMRLTDTEDLADRVVMELSGGERQRVQLARALAQDAPIMLLDEPTANLDLAHQVAALQLIAAAAALGKATLVVLHDLALAARCCHRLLLLAEGEIVADGSPHEVITAASLAQYFGVQAAVRRDDETGELMILPLAATGSVKLARLDGRDPASPQTAAVLPLFPPAPRRAVGVT